jgi:hypothetical protein
MAIATYENQSPSEIRTGDVVTDSLGRTFIALSDAELDMGDFQVLGITAEGIEKWFTLDTKSAVDISYDESVWNQDDI